MKIKYKKLNTLAQEPYKAHRSDAGFDLVATENARITTSSIAAISTGLAFDIPSGYYGQIQERSGFSLKNTLKLKAGVIDAGYHGEVKVVFVNVGDAPIQIFKGDAIAQLVIHKLPLITLEEVKDFDTKTERSEDGFGSSDKKRSEDLAKKVGMKK